MARSDQHGTSSDSDPEDGEILEPPLSKVLASSSSVMKSKTYKSKLSYDFCPVQKCFVAACTFQLDRKQRNSSNIPKFGKVSSYCGSIACYNCCC